MSFQILAGGQDSYEGRGLVIKKDGDSIYDLFVSISGMKNRPNGRSLRIAEHASKAP